MSLLDVGCGPGNLTVDLASRVAPGEVLGIDLAPEIIEIACADAGESPVRFAVGDAYDLRAHGLDTEEDSWDIVHAHQVLQHLTDPVRALQEWRRVLKPGGLLAVRDSDYGMCAIAPHDPLIDRWYEIYRSVTLANGAECNAGRFLPGWVRRSGFKDIRVSTSTWTFADPESRAWWGGLWAERVVVSAAAEQAIAYGLTEAGELQAVSDAWRRWAQDPDGFTVVVGAEVLARA
jgi:SAM-dependent methyltransferase